MLSLQPIGIRSSSQSTMPYFSRSDKEGARGIDLGGTILAPEMGKKSEVLEKV
jgi:hypothetical protein